MKFKLFSSDGIKAHWFTLAFRGDREKQFLEEHFQKSLAHVRFTLLLGIVFYGIFGVLDAKLIPEVKEELWLIRYAIMTPYLLAVFALSFLKPFFQRYMQQLISSVVLIAGLGIIAMTVIAPEPGGNLYYAGLILVFFYGYTFFKLRFIWATLTGWTIVIAYEIAAIWLNPTPVPILINNNFFFLTGNLFGMFACYSIEYYSRRDFIQAIELADEREKVKKANLELEERVKQRTAQLLETNKELTQEVEVRRVTEEALKESEQRFRSLGENAPDIIITLGADGSFTYVNPAWERILGHTPQEVLGRQFIEFGEPEEAKKFIRVFNEIRSSKQTLSDVEGQLISKDGSIHYFSLSGSPNFDSSGNVTGVVGLLKDITERKVTDEQLQYMASHDQLTGLQNRKSFYERLEETISYSDRPRRKKWALLFLDLDRFKDVNDTLGHDIGDELLKKTSRRLEGCLRKSDFIYRLGGDEFTIIATNLSQDIEASMVAQRVLSAVARPFQVKGNEIFVTCSIGISVYPEDGDNVESLVKNADLAMYVAKEESNSYRFFTAEMNYRAVERMKLERNLRQAIEQNQLTLHFQPMVDQDQQIIGVEALLRWKHPDMGLIPPNLFIPLAEETGAIIPIGEWTMINACRQAIRWRAHGHEDLYVSVNLSARQFKQPNLVDLVGKILKETGLPPSCLQLELTETCVMEDPEEAIQKMEALYRLGIRFSIDDFGTGYSSLSYLKRFPVDTLKIDRSFVKDAVSSQEDQEIIRTIISMARNLSMEPLAEGVETREQQEFLCNQGCRLMQGFLFGRPMTGEEFEALLVGQTTPRIKVSLSA